MTDLQAHAPCKHKQLAYYSESQGGALAVGWTRSINIIHLNGMDTDYFKVKQPGVC